MDFDTVRVLFLLHILLFLQTVNGGLIFEIRRNREKGRTHKETNLIPVKFPRHEILGQKVIDYGKIEEKIPRFYFDFYVIDCFILKFWFIALLNKR